MIAHTAMQGEAAAKMGRPTTIMKETVSTDSVPMLNEVETGDNDHGEESRRDAPAGTRMDEQDALLREIFGDGAC